MIYIPLGMRCNSATIFRYELNLMTFSLPFDWCQMTAQSMINWILHRQTKETLEKYFEGFNIKNNKNIKGDWFPHEADWSQKLINKYFRRNNRFQDFLASDEDKTFLVVCGSIEDIELIYSALKTVCNGNIKLITVNVGQFLDESIQINFSIDLNGNWDLWEKAVIVELKKIIK